MWFHVDVSSGGGYGPYDVAAPQWEPRPEGRGVSLPGPPPHAAAADTERGVAAGVMRGRVVMAVGDTGGARDDAGEGHHCGNGIIIISC